MKVQLMIAQPGMNDIAQALRELKAKDVFFDQAITLLVNSQGLSWGAAKDRLEGAEAITGIRLDRSQVVRDDDSPAVADDPLPAKRSDAVQFMYTPLPTEPPADPDAMFCQICTQPIPEKRKTRSTSVCSEKCKNKLDGIRQRQRASRKCPLCLHPSTPQERAEYREWRVSRGDLKSATVITRDYTLPNKTEMAQRLKSVKLFLEHERADLQAQLQAEADKPVGTVLQALADPEKLQRKLEKLNIQIRDIAGLVDKKRG